MEMCLRQVKLPPPPRHQSEALCLLPTTPSPFPSNDTVLITFRVSVCYRADEAVPGTLQINFELSTALNNRPRVAPVPLVQPCHQPQT